MTDVSTWSQTDGSNTSTAPSGAPEGMAPSAVNDVLRAIMGASAREQAHLNFTVTSGGSANAQTLTYTVAPASYFSGQRFAFIAGYSNSTTTPTLNVNSLGAKTIVDYSGAALKASSITAGNIYEAVYDGTNFRLIPIVSFSGPSSSTDGNFALFNGTSGSVVKDSGFSAVPASSGGTGKTSLTSGSIIVGAGTSPVTYLTPSTSGFIIRDNGSSWSPGLEKTLQRFYNSNSTFTSLSTIPFDDTIPQITEGTQIFSQAITPISASSRIRITCTGFFCGNSSICLALFSGGSNALACSIAYATSSSTMCPTTLVYEEASSSTSSRTYTIRAGGDVSAQLNGISSARRYGGALTSTFIVEEVVQ